MKTWAIALVLGAVVLVGSGASPLQVAFSVLAIFALTSLSPTAPSPVKPPVTRNTKPATAAAQGTPSFAVPSAHWQSKSDSCALSFGDGHAEYKVVAVHPDGTLGAGVWRRYSEFAAMRGEFNAFLTDDPFPGKRFRGLSDPTLIEDRRTQLHQWLNFLCKTLPTSQHARLMRFGGEQLAAAQSAKMPPELRRKLESRAVNILRSVFDSSRSADDTPWVLEKERKGEVAVYSCDVPSEQARGSSARRWKFVWDMPVGVQAAAKLCLDYTLRASQAGGWDTAVAGGNIESSFEQDPGAPSLKALVADLSCAPALSEPTHAVEDVATFHTTPQAGGIITPRDFVAVRRFELLADGSLLGVILDHDAPEYSEEMPGSIRGECKEGGAWVQPTATGCRYTSVMMMDIKGSVPTWAINRATTGNLFAQRDQLTKHVAAQPLPNKWEHLVQLSGSGAPAER